MQRKFFSLLGMLALTLTVVVVPSVGHDIDFFALRSDPDLGVRIAGLSLHRADFIAHLGDLDSEELFELLASGDDFMTLPAAQAAVLQAIIAGGDPALGDFEAQAYLDAAADDESDAPAVQRYAWARAGVFAARDGFGAVPGGPSESFNRMQTCLNDGDLVANQTDEETGASQVNGFELDCSSDIVRQAVADVIATGWYQQFGTLVDFDCADFLDQAENGGTAESQIAGTSAYLNGCDGHQSAEADYDVFGVQAVEGYAREIAASSVATDALLSQYFASSDENERMVLMFAAGYRLIADGVSDRVVPVFGDLFTFGTLFGTDAGIGLSGAIQSIIDPDSTTLILGFSGDFPVRIYANIGL